METRGSQKTSPCLPISYDTLLETHGDAVRLKMQVAEGWVIEEAMPVCFAMAALNGLQQIASDMQTELNDGRVGMNRRNDGPGNTKPFQHVMPSYVLPGRRTGRPAQTPGDERNLKSFPAL